MSRRHLVRAFVTLFTIAFSAAAAGAAPPERLRIRIASAGLHELSYESLRSAGVPVDAPGFDPRTLRLRIDGPGPLGLDADSLPASWQRDAELPEVDIWVEGEADGSFDLGDRIVFWALGPEGYADPADLQNLSYARHPYDRFDFAWLEWGAAFGTRISVRSVVVPSPSTTPVVLARHRQHFEEDRVFGDVEDLWYWAETDSVSAGVEFDTDLRGATAVRGELHVALASLIPANDAELSWNRAILGFVQVPIGAETRTFVFRDVGIETRNRLEVAFPHQFHSHVRILHADLLWERPLEASAGVLQWIAERGPETIFEIGGFSGAPWIVDVSDPVHPVRLEGAVPQGAGRWQLRHAGTLRAAYFAQDRPRPLGTVDLELRSASGLRSRTSAPDMLVVTDVSTRAAAERLAAHRRAHFPGGGASDILVATTRDLYDEFSGGRLDPLAIRNCVKFLRQLDPAAPRLQYLLLFGDATYDMRQLLPTSTPTLVPTVYPRYVDPSARGDYAVDDWLAAMVAPATVPGTSPRRFPLPDVAVGRLPVRDASDAERVVDKLIAYDTAGFDAWRGRVLLVADDECTGLFCSEAFWIGNSEALARLVPERLDVRKLYMTEYPFVGREKPQARLDFLRAWNEGCVLLSTDVHADLRLSEEGLFRRDDVEHLINGNRLPLYLSASDWASRFDDPLQSSFGEELIASPRGGAVSIIGPTAIVFVSPTFALKQQLFGQIFASGRINDLPLGVALREAKRRGPPRAGQFNESWTLLGDPAARLAWPRACISFDSGADTLWAGERVRLEGIVHGRDDTMLLDGFDGTVEIDIFGSADDSGYDSPQPGGGNLHIDYDLRGVPIYRGRAPVVRGRFAVTFTVPPFRDGVLAAGLPGASPARLGSKGRVTAYAASSALDAQGGRDSVVVAASSNPDASIAAPRITLRFASAASRVEPGATLFVDLRDENGIAIQGTTAANSIRADFDRRNAPLDLTPSFRAAGADTFGTASIGLPDDLRPGPHTVTVAAADNFGNGTTATLDFEVLEVTPPRLANVLAFPNPFRDGTRFFYELGGPADVEVRVFTISGREVWSGRQRHPDAGRGSMRWDGVDRVQDAVANGTYLYRVEARPAAPGSKPLRYTGRVVVMRD